MQRRKILIGNEWIDSAETISVRNPHTDEVVGEVAKAGPAEMERAVQAAVRGFEETRKLSPDLGMVVDLAVKGDPKGLVLVAHGLRGSDRKINNRKAAMPQTHSGIGRDPGTGAIRCGRIAAYLRSDTALHICPPRTVISRIIISGTTRHASDRTSP